jgi:hypothetical protein
LEKPTLFLYSIIINNHTTSILLYKNYIFFINSSKEIQNHETFDIHQDTFYMGYKLIKISHDIQYLNDIELVLNMHIIYNILKSSDANTFNFE